MLSPQLLRQSPSSSARYVAGRVRVSTLWCWRLLAGGNISVGVLVARLLGQRPPPGECEK